MSVSCCVQWGDQHTERGTTYHKLVTRNLRRFLASKSMMQVCASLCQYQTRPESFKTQPTNQLCFESFRYQKLIRTCIKFLLQETCAVSGTTTRCCIRNVYGTTVQVSGSRFVSMFQPPQVVKRQVLTHDGKVKRSTSNADLRVALWWCQCIGCRTPVFPDVMTLYSRDDIVLSSVD